MMLVRRVGNRRRERLRFGHVRFRERELLLKMLVDESGRGLLFHNLEAAFVPVFLSRMRAVVLCDPDNKVLRDELLRLGIPLHGTGPLPSGSASVLAVIPFVYGKHRAGRLLVRDGLAGQRVRLGEDQSAVRVERSVRDRHHRQRHRVRAPDRDMCREVPAVAAGRRRDLFKVVTPLVVLCVDDLAGVKTALRVVGLAVDGLVVFVRLGRLAPLLQFEDGISQRVVRAVRELLQLQDVLCVVVRCIRHFLRLASVAKYKLFHKRRTGSAARHLCFFDLEFTGVVIRAVEPVGLPCAPVALPVQGGRPVHGIGLCAV